MPICCVHIEPPLLRDEYSNQITSFCSKPIFDYKTDSETIFFAFFLFLVDIIQCTYVQ